MKNTISVGLACNDEHGNLSTLRMVEIGDERLFLEGDILDGEPIAFGDDFLEFLGEVTACIDFSSRARHVGNICWDQVEVEPAQAAALVNYLRILPHWTCTVGESGLFTKWQEGVAFTAADFKVRDDGEE